MNQDKQQTKQKGCQNGYGYIAGAADDTGSNGPEQESGVGGLLHSGAETDNGQCAHHAQGQHHVGGDDQNYQSGDHAQHDQAAGEAGAVVDTCIGDPVNEHDEQAQQEGQGDGNQDLAHGDGGEFLDKLTLDNVDNIDHNFRPLFLQ